MHERLGQERTGGGDPLCGGFQKQVVTAAEETQRAGISEKGALHHWRAEVRARWFNGRP